MHDLDLAFDGNQLRVNSFPDAVNFKRLDSHLARRMSSLHLHSDDLKFAASCLEAINVVNPTPPVVVEALWRSSIVFFMKCFGESEARHRLSAEKVFKSEIPETLVVFDFFKNIRNKHLVHDANSFAQSLPIAVLNNGTKSFKVESVSCVGLIVGTLNDVNYSNLTLLIEKARAWVEREFDSLGESLRAELESMSYDHLLAKPDAVYKSPSMCEIDKNRHLL